MGLVKGLLGLAATAGAAFAAVKVARKYEENKELDIEAAAAGEEPEEVPAGSALGDLARAAGDVLNEAGAKVRGAAEKAGVNTEGLKDALHGAGSAIVDAGTAVAGYVAEEAPAAVERLKDGAQDVLARVKETVAGMGEADEELFAEEEDEALEAAEEAAETQAGAEGLETAGEPQAAQQRTGGRNARGAEAGLGRRSAVKGAVKKHRKSSPLMQ